MADDPYGLIPRRRLRVLCDQLLVETDYLAFMSLLVEVQELFAQVESHYAAFMS
jgi:hypothetical protein